jgi:hypothetical protein
MGVHFTSIETTIMDAPKVFKTIEEARKYAWQISCISNYFIYIFWSTQGLYIVDSSGEGIPNSDEELIETYYKGLKQ